MKKKPREWYLFKWKDNLEPYIKYAVWTKTEIKRQKLDLEGMIRVREVK